ncbi:hypothetical protein V8C43DRAFT_67607 [Trichoderma afarasin]
MNARDKSSLKVRRQYQESANSEHIQASTFAYKLDQKFLSSLPCATYPHRHTRSVPSLFRHWTVGQGVAKRRKVRHDGSDCDKTLFPFSLFSFSFFSFFLFPFFLLTLEHVCSTFRQTARTAGPHSRFTPLARQSLSHNRESERRKKKRRDETLWFDPARAYQMASLMHRTSPTVGRGEKKKQITGGL